MSFEPPEELLSEDSEEPLSEDDEKLLWQAWQLSDSKQQIRLLDDACGEHPARRSRLLRYLHYRQPADDLFRQLDNSGTPWLADVQGQQSDSPPGFPQQGSTLGGFELQELVGRGGMGNVFRARDVRLGREVAVKLPRLDVVGVPGIYRRFLGEARTAAQLNHPGLVSILEVGSDGPFVYIASQWCGGGDFSAWLADHPAPHPPREVAGFMLQLCDAIEYCHQQGVIHLDLKPSNILLATEEHHPKPRSLSELSPKISDFGVAQLLDTHLAETLSSAVLGTPQYMAPEQAFENAQPGPATDIYALGVILYELLFGERLFEGKPPLEVLERLRSSESLVLPRDNRVPKDLRTIAGTCLERRPADRYASARALAEDLRRYLDGAEILARPTRWTRRLWLWTLRPQRITQAGSAAIVIQLGVLMSFYSHLVLIAIGYEVPIELPVDGLLQEILPITLFPHLPLLINGIRTVRHRRGAVTIGTALSLVFCGILVVTLAGGPGPFSIYRGNVLAHYIAHIAYLTFALAQLGFHLAALPAAWHQRQNPR